MMRHARCLVGLGVIVAVAAGVRAQPAQPNATAPPRLPILTLQAALEFALENNPTLAAQRQQHGIAAARVVIADTYPFNPVLENRIQAASGAASAGITNNVPVEHIFVWEFEMRRQGRYRRQGAAAALSRTDWEIAYQEQTLAVQVVRTYGAMLYRQEKLKLLEETLRLNQRLVEDIRHMVVDLGKLRPADLILAPTEVSDAIDGVSAGHELLVAARQDLYRQLGVVDGEFELEGPLAQPPWSLNAAALCELAVGRRADLRAREMAVAESSANARLTAANRFGNPSIGPAFTYDPSRVSQIGIQINVPIPLNTRKGEMMQSQAEYNQAVLQLRQAEIGVRQDVASAVARLTVAEQRTEQFRTKVLPDLQRAVAEMDRLYRASEPGVDLQRLIDVRRKLLKARDGYLDALWSVRQARADIQAATGEPVLNLCNPASK